MYVLLLFKYGEVNRRETTATEKDSLLYSQFPRAGPMPSLATWKLSVG